MFFNQLGLDLSPPSSARRSCRSRGGLAMEPGDGRGRAGRRGLVLLRAAARRRRWLRPALLRLRHSQRPDLSLRSVLHPGDARRTLEQIQAQQAQPKGGSEGRIITSSGYVGTSPPRFSDSAKEERLSYTKQLAAQPAPAAVQLGGGGATPRTPTAREVRAELFAEDTGANRRLGRGSGRRFTAPSPRRRC